MTMGWSSEGVWGDKVARSWREGRGRMVSLGRRSWRRMMRHCVGVGGEGGDIVGVGGGVFGFWVGCWDAGEVDLRDGMREEKSWYWS